LSASPYGTFDQAGNVWEWTEEVIGSDRVLRSGSCNSNSAAMQASYRNYLPPTDGYNNTGFRVASIPEPSTSLLTTLALLFLAIYGRRRKH